MLEGWQSTGCHVHQDNTVKEAQKTGQKYPKILPNIVNSTVQLGPTTFNGYSENDDQPN